MTVEFRDALRSDVGPVVDLLRQDALGQKREVANLETYLAAFDEMSRDKSNDLIVGDLGGQVVATYQITFILGLSLSASKRAQIEGVRVVPSLRWRGIGRAMFADAETRARKAGCALMQLTMNRSRTETHAFYEQIGYVPSHTGWKRYLD